MLMFSAQYGSLADICNNKYMLRIFATCILVHTDTFIYQYCQPSGFCRVNFLIFLCLINKGGAFT